MPCRTDPEDYGYVYVSPEFMRIPVLLCEAMQMIERANMEPSCSPELRQWWAAHKAADKRLIEEELARQKLEKDRKAAIDKLTPHERKLLGLP